MKYSIGLNSEVNFNFPLFKDFSRVGMIRGENLCINQMQYFLNENFCSYVTNYLNFIAKVFDGKEVWYRTADLVPHQINLFDGADAILDDKQYLIGIRGVRRNIIYKETYLKELEAFIKAYKCNNNLGLLIPFVSSPEEVEEVRNILSNLHYDGKLGIMVEIPSVIFRLNEYNNLGIDNYTIGVNDLTTMILGADRDIKTYSINDKSVHNAIAYTTEKIHSFNKEVTLAGYLNKEMYNFANGIDIDYFNVHYNEIPLIFDVENPEFYKDVYQSIKRNYKEIKRTRTK